MQNNTLLLKALTSLDYSKITDERQISVINKVAARAISNYRPQNP